MIYSFLHLNVNKSTDSIILGCMLGILAVAVNYLLAKKFVSDQVRYMIDEETGQCIAFHDRSSFMFIPNRYWTWIYAIGFILVSVLFIKK